MSKRPIGRPKLFKSDCVVSLRLETDAYGLVKEVAAYESIYRGKQISALELIRQAIKYVFEDNERLRDCFKRSRRHLHKSPY